VVISKVDRVKILLPSLGGFLMSIRKMAQYVLLLAVLALHWSIILVILVVGYVVKSCFSYLQTKKRYELNLTRNLYYQKIASDDAVAYHLMAQALEHLQSIELLAWYAKRTMEPGASSDSDRRLRRRCERLMREWFDVEVEFPVDLVETT
ncbi:MAG: DUF3754 domain-containing protein, partial [Planctomycetota bacterium]